MSRLIEKVIFKDWFYYPPFSKEDVHRFFKTDASNMPDWIIESMILYANKHTPLRAQILLAKYYGLMDNEKHTLKSLGIEFGISGPRVRQIIQKRIRIAQARFRKMHCRQERKEADENNHSKR